MRATFFKGVALGAAVAMGTLMTTAAFAGSGIGGVFNLGTGNTVNAGTGLTGSVDGSLFGVHNNSTGTHAGGISIYTTNNKPPLAVNSTGKVGRLNADLLDGKDSTNFQPAMNVSCNGALKAIGPNGGAGCAKFDVKPIALTISSSDPGQLVQFGPDLELGFSCGMTSPVLSFSNVSPSAGTLNWMFSEGGTTSTVNAGGQAVASFGYVPFDPGASRRLEGQWIFSVSGNIVTAHVHAFDDGAGHCEFTGTADVTYA